MGRTIIPATRRVTEMGPVAEPARPAPISALLGDLTPPQKAAVTTPSTLVAVIAGAGSGKTRVLTRRIAHRIAIGTADARPTPTRPPRPPPHAGPDVHPRGRRRVAAAAAPLRRARPRRSRHVPCR